MPFAGTQVHMRCILYKHTHARIHRRTRTPPPPTSGLLAYVLHHVVLVDKYFGSKAAALPRHSSSCSSSCFPIICCSFTLPTPRDRIQAGSRTQDGEQDPEQEVGKWPGLEQETRHPPTLRLWSVATIKGYSRQRTLIFRVP